jgi:hypothetical protein
MVTTVIVIQLYATIWRVRVRDKEKFSMPELGVTVAVIRDNAVLLTKREDFDV